MKADIDQLLRLNRGILRRADHPEIRRRLDGLVYRNVLCSPLPGIICVPGATDVLAGAVRAGWLWAGPDSVLLGRAAARLSFWPEAEVSVFQFAVPRDHQSDRPPWSLTHRRIPPELIRRHEGVQISSPALTAVDLAAGPDGGDVIDRALRSRQTTIAELRRALSLTPRRAGNPIRRQLLLDSRDSPWSEGERLLHRLLRANHIPGWTTNQWVKLPDLSPGRGAYVDVLFRKEKVAVEVDGYQFHSDRPAFEGDRRRRNELVLAGYLVLNVTWAQLVDDPDWVIACIRGALARRA